MKLLSLFFTILVCTALMGQTSDSTSSYKAENSPIIGVGVNSIGFFGDLNDRKYSSPIGGNIGFDVFVIQPLSDYFNLNFHLMAGKIREEERSIQRSVNFSSDIYSGGILFEYNFGHFLPEYRRLTPFITAGAEFVQFDPKSDLTGFGGEPYNYWSDGSIRNVPENGPGSEFAVIVQRDYNYETDMRDAGFNASTTYTERAFSIPLGFGFDMHLTDQINFRFYSTVHLTFTDYMDGISRTSDTSLIGPRPANGRNDIFLTTGVSLSYNFQKVPSDEFKNDFERRKKEEQIDYLALGYSEDQDRDGVIDLIDKCPDTPAESEVDSLGCPIDSDGDGIPDFKDQEVNSEFPEFANQYGVEMTDQMIYESYLRYIDSTYELAEVVERQFSANSRRRRTYQYRVQVGEFNVGEAPEDMSTLLSIGDLGKLDQDGKTLYTAGRFNTLAQANRRKQELINDGFEESIVLERNKKGKYIPLTSAQVAASSEIADNSVEVEKEPSEPQSDKVVFRVQLGAFKNQPTTEKYNEIPSLFVVESGGYYRYMSGSFSTFEEAAKHKVKMVVEGYKGAFVVAYKGGKRVTLKSVGVQSINSDPIIGQ